MSALIPFNATLSARPGMSAIILMVLASGILSSQHGLVRFLSNDFHPFEIVFFRNLFGLAVFLPWIIRHGTGAFATEHRLLHVARAVTNGGSLMAYFFALSLIPLVDATALFLTFPLFVAVGAMLFLGERVGLKRWVAFGLGSAGAIIVLQPGLHSALLGSVLVLIAATCAAGTRLLAKSLSSTDSPATIVAYVSLLMTPLTAIPAAFYWRWPETGDLVWLFAVGASGALGQLCFVKAYSLVDISFAEPIVFTRLIWAGLIGFFIFAEIPAAATLIGGALIVAAATILIRDRTTST